MCSPLAQAVDAVMDGAPTRDAAKVFGCQDRNVYAAVSRRRALQEPTAAQLRAYRRILIERTIKLNKWAQNRFDLLGRKYEAQMLEWPDISEAPRIDMRGADHEELPDPERLQAVGWGEARAARRG